MIFFPGIDIKKEEEDSNSNELDTNGLPQPGKGPSINYSPIAQRDIMEKMVFPKINSVLSKLRNICLERQKLPNKTVPPFIKCKKNNYYRN